MPLLKMSASKAKPKDGITYITNEKKAKIVTVRNLFEDEDYAEQFNETAKRFNKGDKLPYLFEKYKEQGLYEANLPTCEQFIDFCDVFKSYYCFAHCFVLSISYKITKHLQFLFVNSYMPTRIRMLILNTNR